MFTANVTKSGILSQKRNVQCRRRGTVPVELHNGSDGSLAKCRSVNAAAIHDGLLTVPAGPIVLNKLSSNAAYHEKKVLELKHPDLLNILRQMAAGV